MAWFLKNLVVIHIFCNISAKFGKNIDELLDMIALEAEVMELKADPDQPAAGSVVKPVWIKAKGLLPLCWFNKELTRW